jgi:predicted dehydrogenase
MKNKLKCAIIGYGYMGEIRHRIVRQHPETELLMVCETNPENLTKDYNYSVVRDSKEVIESDVDVVFVCTPNDLIPDLAVKCLERGKNVFCEKPPGKTLSDIVKIMAAEKENPSTKLMFGFNHRYHPGIMKAKAIVDSGRMGKVIVLRGLYGKSGGNNFTKSWRNNFDISGGGILLDQGIHMLDLFNFFLGEFTSVKSFLSNSQWGFNVEDNAVIILRNDKDQLGMLHSSATFWKHMFQLNIILERGYLQLEGLLSKTGSYGRETLVIGRRQFEDETEAIGNPSEETIYFDNDMSWELEVDQFVESILKDKPVTACNSRDAYNAMDLVHRCYQDSGFSTYKKVRN